VQPICLPERGNSYTGKRGIVSGWGATSYPQGKLASNLQRASTEIIENSECRKKLKIDYVYSTMLCAIAGNCSGTCFGDSGGPLVVRDKETGTSTLVGLVSFGIGGCALFPYWPDVYTRVASFLDWTSYAVV
jgi:secreted trypsin-like serine protease